MTKEALTQSAVKPTPENKIFGTYRQRDTGIEYSYEATWQETGQGGSWTGRLLRANADLAGQPGSRIMSTHGLDFPAYVRLLVEQSINDLAAGA